MTNSLPPLDQSLSMALLRAREGTLLPVREMLANSGITEQQWRVLRILDQNGPTDSSSLAAAANLHFPSLTRITQTMISKGYITRTQDPNDRRRHMIAIAEAGAQLINNHREKENEITQEYRNILGEENYLQLIELLAILDPKSKTDANSEKIYWTKT